jgi:hypothetical protein
MSPETKSTLVVVIVAPILFWVASRVQFKMYEPLFMLAIFWITLKHVFTPIRLPKGIEKMDF